MEFENPLRPLSYFLTRLVRHVFLGLLLIALSLFAGMIGYHHLAGLPWIDSFLNASMILSGMGPVDHLETTGAKLFAGFYAIYSGLLFIALIGIIASPIFHHFFHVFHIKEK
jgi:hypothetical protein